MMVNNYININKANNHLSPSLTEHKHDTWRWKSRFCFGTGTEMCWG